MAMNPIVDGIANLAIPDSDYGVSFSYHKIPGSIYGRGVVVSGPLELAYMEVGRCIDLTEMIVKDDGRDYFDFYSDAVPGDICLQNTKTNHLQLNKVTADYLTLDYIDVEELLYVAGTTIEKSINIFGADIGFLFLSDENLICHGTLTLDCTKVFDYEPKGGLIIAKNVDIGRVCKIPANLREALDKAPDLYSRRFNQD
jgi:hypothetical protein